jgi:hypothetical protein
MNIFRIALVGAALWGSVSSANAAVSVYTSEADFDAAVGAVTSFGFDEGNSDAHYHVASNPYTQSGITFANNVTAPDLANGGSPILFLIGAATTPNYGQDFLSFQNTDVGLSADITTPGVTAFGFDYASYIVGGVATIAVNGGLPVPITVTGTPSFIGFTSTAPITDLNILFPTGYSFDLTKVSYGTALIPPVSGAVPEPATWVMMIGGFALIGATMRRRRGGPVVRYA